MLAEPRKSVAEMTGESLREFGVLIMVFYPIREGLGGAFSWMFAIFIFVFGWAIWAVGVVVERRRKL